jgi:hypothetical protein
MQVSTDQLASALSAVQKQQAELMAAFSLLNKKLERKNYFMPTQSVKTPEEEYKERVFGNVELMREAIASGQWEAIESLTSEWTKEFKAAVASHLTKAELSLVRQIKAAYSQYLEPAAQAYTKAMEDYQAAIAKLSLPSFTPTEYIPEQIPLPSAGLAYQKLENGLSLPVPAHVTAPVVVEKPVEKLSEAVPEQSTKPAFKGWGKPQVTIGKEVVDRLSSPEPEETIAEKEARASIEQWQPAWLKQA